MPEMSVVSCSRTLPAVVHGAAIAARGFVTPRALAAALQRREAVSDQDFESFFAPRFRSQLRRESTPVAIAIRAARLLADGQPRRILDIGSGLGKFCTIGALTTRAFFTGVEQNARHILAARGAALRFGARRIVFICDDAEHTQLFKFDGLYLFASASSPAPSSRSLRDILWRRAEDVRTGTRLVTYGSHGEPPGFRLLREETTNGDRLALFEKT